ncbi:MAG: TrmH family RNA methyltransferase [Clostridiaceae bacterium]
MKKITSKDNIIIKEAKKLKEKKYRTEKNSFLIEGFRFIEEAIKSDYNVEKMFIDEDALEKCYEFDILNNIDDSIEIYIVNKLIINLLSDTENSQGIIAIVRDKIREVSREDGFYIFVDKVQDPGNLGTIIRSADASGAKGVILNNGTVDLYNEKTLRSTMGSIFKLPVILDKNLALLKELKANGFKVIGSSLNTKHNFFDINLKSKIIIVVGNEGRGMSSEIDELCDSLVKIPMPGNAESLNVAIAASIMMFEVVRQNITDKS